MPRKTARRIPSYRLHKPTGLGVVRLNGRDVYLGSHGTPESWQEHRRVVAEWLASNEQHGPGSECGPQYNLSLNEIFVPCWRFAR